MLRQRCMTRGSYGTCDLQAGHPGPCLVRLERLQRLQRCAACGGTERSRSIFTAVCWACIGAAPAEDDTVGRVCATFEDEIPREDEPERLEVPE